MEIELIKGDITRQSVDAIVNAANTSLLGGGGVDGAIHRAGGPAILEACKKIGGCKTGEAVLTPAGQLPARVVIHTPGPVWQGGDQNETRLLENSYRNSLKLADAHKLQSIAFPNISTGVYGFPKKEAASIALTTVKNFTPEHLKKVVFVCFDEENYSIYKTALGQN
ncbi:O-acetyl-ADP-ribose deacetylase [Robertkochia flava]|uniref:O-acetyl-ADP-ribose deacetylase n=1 Tax=Robertkochia flava TaxID=3447986 RepID=UPI001CCE8539|nr:O-acetyl-ADP-ribose deacetylase [Robertkochia marina]